MMARIDYRTMSLAARGLLYSLRLECWVNRRLPADPAKLARMLGIDAAEVAALLPDVMGFFGTDGTSIVCPELDDYRAHLEDRDMRKLEGAKKGARTTNARSWGSPSGEPSGEPTGSASGEPSGEPTASRRVSRRSTVGSSVQNSQDQNNQIHGHEGESHSTWINDYEAASRGT